MKYTHKPYGPYEKFIKRPLDFVLSLGAIIVLSPVMGVTAIIVKKKLGSPVIFTQMRPGKIDPKTGEEKIFKLYKFRTMTDERDDNGNLLSDDIRLTRFGKFLRSTSLDEIPELFNIVKGDMAIVGPRPLLVEYLPYYTNSERRRHIVRPGLTGLAQINGRNNTPWKERFKYDNDYVNDISLKKDISICAMTFLKIIKQSDVVVAGSNDILDLDEERSS